MAKLLKIEDFEIRTRKKPYKVKVNKDLFNIDDHWQTWLR